MQPSKGESPDKISLVEEETHLDKREVSTGKVRIRTVVDQEKEIIGTCLHEDKVEVTRVPVGKVVDEVPTTRTEGDVTIIPILEEMLVVEKRLVLKEEIHVRRTTEVEKVQVPVVVRKQRAIVDTVPAEQADRSSDDE